MCFKVKKCCFCINLHVGTKIISIVSTILSAALMLLYGTAATTLRMQDSKMQFYMGMAVVAACQCLLGFALMYGAFTKSPRWMWPWTVFCWCASVALLVLCALGSVALAVSGGFQQAADANVMISAYFVYSLFMFYCACVVNSRRLQLLSEPYPEYQPTLTLSPPGYPYSLKP